VAELVNLVHRLTQLSDIVAKDIAGFREWLDRQRLNYVFNVGCLFAVDAEGHLRVCLHPKIVRSQFETNPLPEQHMQEADLLTLVTLCPVEKQYFSVTLQPLLCSDALSLNTDQPGGSPMEAVNTYAGCFGDQPPDHIDVVSVATCTPQPEDRAPDGRRYREWHEQFQDAFRNAAQHPNFARHHFAAIVLANFRTLISGRAGGLSGVFLPVPPRYKHFHPDIVVSCWGRPKDQRRNNNWSRPDDDALISWSSRGFVATLDPFSEPVEVPVKILGFTIQRLPRDNSPWETSESLTQCEVRVGLRDRAGTVIFSRRDDSHV
jgi:hypothetical protein